jgi:hypothetical protein
MRPDVAPLGALMFPTAPLVPALRLDADPTRVALRAGFDGSSFDLGAAFSPRSGVLSRHDTNVRSRPGLSPPSGLPLRLAIGEISGLAPVGLFVATLVAIAPAIHCA